MAKFGDLKLRNKMFSGNTVVLILVIILGIVTFNTTSKLLKTGEMVNHTHVVIEQAMDILAAAVDMETGMRGYLLAGQEDFLAPYTNGYTTFKKDVAGLKNTVSDNPAQVTLLGEIEQNINEWVKNVTEPIIQLRRDSRNSNNMNAIADLVGEAKGKVYFDKFRDQVGTFTEREQSLMEIRRQTASDTARNAKMMVVAGTITIMVISILVSIFVTAAITKPVKQAVDFADSLAQGDMTQRLKADTKDEVGTLSSALNKIAEDLGNMLKQVQTSSNFLTESSGSLSTVSTSLSETSDETSGRAQAVASASEELSVNMNSVSAAMEQSSTNVGMVATAAEEMSATVNEIAQNTAKAKSISEDAVDQSQKASTKITELGKAADKIGRVTETITEISEQTNLLALNATIEAARAGEAGKGFAVVANEIKDLAKQTAEATVDIKNQIDEMQGTTDATIADIKNVSEIIDQINDVITTVATAVEEQSAATSEISENVAQASTGIAEVNENVSQSSVAVEGVNQDITEISNGATEINSSSQNVNQNAIELSKLAEELTNLVSRFKVA